MKVTLTFELPKEENEHKLALRGPGFFSLLWDLQMAMRQVLKYDTPTKDFQKFLDEWYSQICEATNGIE